jgi:Ca2+-dependent lipid-binding protein
MFVTVSVVCSWIVGIFELSMTSLLTLLYEVVSEFWEVQTFRPHVTFLQRDAQLNWTLLFVAVSVVCSWLLGATGLSLAWLLLLLALVAAVWKTSLVRLVEAAISYETLRVRRKRALSQDETAEWFNFLLNRW